MVQAPGTEERVRLCCTPREYTWQTGTRDSRVRVWPGYVPMDPVPCHICHGSPRGGAVPEASEVENGGTQGG